MSIFKRKISQCHQSICNKFAKIMLASFRRFRSKRSHFKRQEKVAQNNTSLQAQCDTTKIRFPNPSFHQKNIKLGTKKNNIKRLSSSNHTFHGLPVASEAKTESLVLFGCELGWTKLPVFFLMFELCSCYNSFCWFVRIFFKQKMCCHLFQVSRCF